MLEYIKLNIKFSVTRELVLPVYKGSTLRGMFKTSLRRACCVSLKTDCGKCLDRKTCSYAQICEHRTETGENTVLPYVIGCSDLDKQRYEENEELTVALCLFGKASAHLPVVIASLDNWRHLDAAHFQGFFSRKEINALGPPSQWPAEQAPRGRLRLKSVEQVIDDDTRLVYKPGVTAFRPPQPQTLTPPASAMSDSEQWRVFVDFIAPLRLFRKIQQDGGKKKKRLITSDLFDFQIFFRAIQTRWYGLVSHFSTAAGQEGCPADLPDVSEKLLSAVKLAQNELFIEEIRRYKKNGRQWNLYDGLMGCVMFDRVPSAFIPWMMTGELLQVGKFPTMGYGQFRAAYYVL